MQIAAVVSDNPAMLHSLQILGPATIPSLVDPSKVGPVYGAGQIDWFFPSLIIGAILLVLMTLFDLICSGPRSDRRKFGWLAFWTLVPAFWFTIEYHWVYPKFRDPSVNFEYFKYGQEIAAKFWAGIVALVGAIALKK